MKKTKKFLSLLLAMVMSLSLAAPVFAAEPEDDPNAGIMPLANLYQDPSINNGTGDHRTTSFTSTPGNGKFIKVWFANRSNYPVTVDLYVVGQTNPVESWDFGPNSYADNGRWHVGSDTEAVTYYVRIRAKNANTIVGYLSVAQYPTMTA